jgi:hypothetical protein
MLDHIERRRFLVEPAGEDPAPALVRPLHVDLDERSGQFFLLPRRGRLAGAQPHDHVLPAHRLTGPQRHVLDDSVALVEDPEHRDALRHRRDSTLPCRRRRRVRRRRRNGILLLGAAATSGERKPDQQRCGKPRHFYSGIQGS